MKKNVRVAGGMAPVRPYISIEPRLVFDMTLGLDRVFDAYAATDQRQSIKVLLEP